jgi:hypothetical protein
MEFIINEKLVNQILNYLAVKPFNEVHFLISEIQKIQPLDSDVQKEMKKVDK